MATFYLIDGNAYIHRAYHALPPLTTSKGLLVNAVYGFLKLTLKIIKNKKPDYLVICFDYPALTFRHGKYAAYKANRKEMEDGLKSQFPLVKEACKALNFNTVEIQGFEADDIIATLSRQAGMEGQEVVIVTSDKDTYQLVNDNVKIYNESKETMYDASKIREKFGIEPSQIVDYLALMGDSSDNVPGAKGIGEKTAVKLLNEFGSVDNLLANTDKLSGRLKSNVVDSIESIKLSKELVTLDYSVPVNNRWNDFAVKKPKSDDLADFLKKFEFNSLLKEFADANPAAIVNKQTHALVTRITSNADMKIFIEALAIGAEVALIIHDSPLLARSTPVFAAALSGNRVFVTENEEYLALILAEIKKNTSVIYVYDIKSMLHLKHTGVLLYDKRVFDTMIASYCLNPVRNNQSLRTLTMDYLNSTLHSYQGTEDSVQLTADEANSIFELGPILSDSLKNNSLDTLFKSLEMPVSFVLLKMEKAGILINRRYVLELKEEFKSAISVLEKEIYKLAGEEFNLNSPKQLAVILFEKLKLPAQKKIKTGYSTNEEVLLALSGSHPLPKILLEYRELQKLLSTYIESILNLADPDTDRIHTTLNQTVTATGRLSSTEPNLQNIPVRSQYGRRIRKAFIAGPGMMLVSLDYSQIDLRVLAHLSKDEALKSAFKQGKDIHSIVAAEVFNIPESEVSTENRRIAKTINFGIVYGISPFGLAQQLNISPDEAKHFIDSYFEKYPGVKTWLDNIVREARKNGSVQTILGRVRHLPDINSSNFQQRSFAERTAMNTPVQGSSADIIKAAMLKIDGDLIQAGYSAVSEMPLFEFAGTDMNRADKPDFTMIMQVHDDLLFEIPQESHIETARYLKDIMENCIQLDVPLIVDVKAGNNWEEMHKVSL